MKRITRKCNRCNRIINTDESWYTFKMGKNTYMTMLSDGREVIGTAAVEEKVLCEDCYQEVVDWYNEMENIDGITSPEYSDEGESKKAFRHLLDEYYSTPKHWESYKALKAAVEKLDKIEKIVKLPTEAVREIVIRYKYEAICKVLGIEE